jgi:hypothetical protein
VLGIPDFFHRLIMSSTDDIGRCFMLYGFVAPQDGKTTANPMQTESLYQQLLQWFDGLTKQFEDVEGIGPRLVLLQCRYQHVILALFRPFAAPISPLSTEVAFYEERARKITKESTDALRHLVQSHMAMTGCNIFPYYYCPMVACNIIDEFRQIQQTAMSQQTEDVDDIMGYSYYHLTELIMQSPSYSIFMSCLRHLLDIGSSLYMSQLALRAVQTAAERSEVAFPFEVWELFGKLDQPKWIVHARKNVVSSFAPGKTAQDADGSRLDELLDSWEKMSMNPVGQDEGIDPALT